MRMLRQAGFTLIEIAITLVIIGLLLGAALKGKELITNARVRSLIAQQEGIRAAYFGFLDRYHSPPGDYGHATLNVDCRSTCLNGNGDGRIESNAVPVNGSEVHEEILAWSHLCSAGFLNAGHAMVAGDSAPNDANNPVNAYRSYLQLIYDGNYGTAASGALRHNLKTGNQIPVELLAEADRKIDDSLPNTGSFQFSTYAPPGGISPIGGTAAPASCTGDASQSANWNTLGDGTNCGAANLL